MVTFQDIDCQGNTLTTHANHPTETAYKAYVHPTTIIRPNRAERRKKLLSPPEGFKKFYRSSYGSY